MNYNSANIVAPGGPQHYDEQPLPIPKACALRRRDVLELVGAYAGGQVVRDGQEDLFEMVLGLDPTLENYASSLVVLAWDINLVRARLACVVDPGSPHPWLLRIEMTDHYIAMALNWAVPWQHFYTGMDDIVNSRPLAATIMSLHTHLVWLELLDKLGNHFGVLEGATMFWWPPCIIPWSLEIDMCDPGPEIDMSGIDNGDVRDNNPQGGKSGRPLGAFQQDSAPALRSASPMDIEKCGITDKHATDNKPPAAIPLAEKTLPRGSRPRASVIPFTLM